MVVPVWVHAAVGRGVGPRGRGNSSALAMRWAQVWPYAPGIAMPLAPGMDVARLEVLSGTAWCPARRPFTGTWLAKVDRVHAGAFGPRLHSCKSEKHRQGTIHGEQCLVVEVAEDLADVFSRDALGLVHHDLGGFAQPVID